MDRYEPEPVAPFDTPLSVQIIDGEVVFIGAGRVAFSMTLRAAAETSQRLEQALFSAWNTPQG
jgi:hypothetical protein